MSPNISQARPIASQYLATFSAFFPHPARITRLLADTDQLIKFQLYCLRVTSLGVLDHEDHEKRNDRRSGVNDKLPGVRPTEERAGGRPQKDYREREHKRARATYLPLDPARKPREQRRDLRLGIRGRRSVLERHSTTMTVYPPHSNIAWRNQVPV